MRFKFNSKYTTIAIYVILVFAACLGLVAFVFKFGTVASYIKKILSVLAPVIWGICIAYIINPFMVFCDRHFRKWFCKKKDRKNMCRALSITVSMIFFLGILAAVIGSIVPEIKDTLVNFFRSLPTYLSNLQGYIESKISDLAKTRPELKRFIDTEFSSIQDTLLKYSNELKPMVEDMFSEGGLISSITDSAWAFLMGLKNFLLGIFISIYLLYSKEMFLAQMTKITHALFSEKKTSTILRVASKTNSTFTSFLTGKTLDSLIIGILAFIGLEAMGLKNYAVLLAIVIGITNMIPFFGPIIGAVPCAVLILLTSPDKVLIFIIFILILQQFDGNILGPKILGNSLGLSPFWIMFAIFIGGGLFGFIGMVVFVPLFAVIYSITNEIMTTRLKKKDLPLSTSDYVHERTEPTIHISSIGLPRYITNFIEKKRKGKNETEKRSKK